MSREPLFRPVCVRCGKGLGLMSEDEFAVLESDGFDSCLCFNCEPGEGWVDPDFFFDLQQGDQVQLDGEMFYYDDGLLKRVQPAKRIEGTEWYLADGGTVDLATRAHERTHERTRARVSSSYTYLNRTPKNRALLGNGFEVACCPLCHGLGYYPEMWEKSVCPSCDGTGTVVLAIVIPLWIIQEGENNV